ncbi:MAG: glutamate-1-semialdehyde 2,1-aminomutase [Actinomycetaceae bacterium]|nr:glutamate-1-semialdehyde 2,1-aminomutase [Actinomycetaceae bacterium]
MNSSENRVTDETMYDELDAELTSPFSQYDPFTPADDGDLALPTQSQTHVPADTNAELFARAGQVIPGGVDSPVRAYGSVGGTPPFIQSAGGSIVRDVEGKRYVDLVGSWGPALLGHAHPEVVRAVQEAAEHGLSFGAPTKAEVELAQAVIDRVSPVQKIRFVSTGTEATMTAIRLARGTTGRDLLVKFAGCYHGHSDSLLAQAGSGVATQGIPGSAGVPAATSADTIVMPYGDLPALEELFNARGDKIAAIITEAAPANMGVITPPAGFNAALVDLAHRHGALVIIDEVLTGFRVSRAGYWGLEQDTDPYQPDLMTFGKVIGGGLPLAAVGGRAEVMDLLAPLGPVYQAGTLSGNPLATAAGLATLNLANDLVYGRLDSLSQVLVDGLTQTCEAQGMPFALNRAGNLFSVFFGAEPGAQGVANYEQAKTQSQDAYRAFFHSMLEAGVYLPPSPFEAWFVSSAHTDEDVATVLDALPAAVEAGLAAL